LTSTPLGLATALKMNSSGSQPQENVLLSTKAPLHEHELLAERSQVCF
jgi:hypothetical protein